MVTSHQSMRYHPSNSPENSQAEQRGQTLIQITDTHLMANADETFLGINPEQSFHAVMEDIRQKYPDFDVLIHTGDLAQEAEPSTYARYLAYMQQLNIETFQVPGNHDDLNCFPLKQALPMPTVIDLQHWSIILLNTAMKGRIDGWIQAEQLEQLRPILQQRQNKHLIIGCHHHPFDMKSAWIDQHKLKNTDALTEVFQAYPNIKAVLCGHVHQDSIHTWNNIAFLSTPSTCVQFKPLQHDFALDQIAPGYRCLHLNADGSFSSQVQRVYQAIQSIDNEITGY